jgi:hypothetical protein
VPLLLPLFVAAVGHDIIGGYDQWRSGQRTVAVSGLNGQWASFAGGRLRLQSLHKIDGVNDYDGKPLPLPSTVAIWQATIDIDAPDDADLTFCDIVLQDANGDTFQANPPELNGADIDLASCLRPFDAPASGTFTTVATFVTATASAIEGVRVTVTSDPNGYVWLTSR